MSNEYISRESVLADIEQTIENSECVNHESEIIDCVRYADAADVAPVVRCGECIHRVNMEHSMDNKEICCGRMAMRVMALDDYCSHGVRIDGGEHHAD